MIIPVAAAIIHDKGKFMIARRAAHKHLAGYWEFPGGKIEQNETPENCLLRELDEELKIKVKIIRYVGQHTHMYDGFTILLIAYLCRLEEGIFTLTDHDQIKWVTFDQLSENKLAPADIPLLEFLKDVF